jgi:hypothetical protein
MEKVEKFESQVQQTLDALTNDLNSNRMMKGVWESMVTSGNQPEAREGHCMINTGSHVYVFGGFARSLFSDLKMLTLSTLHWRGITPKDGNLWPKPRQKATIHHFQDKLYIFGG